MEKIIRHALLHMNNDDFLIALKMVDVWLVDRLVPNLCVHLRPDGKQYIEVFTKFHKLN